MSMPHPCVQSRLGVRWILRTEEHFSYVIRMSAFFFFSESSLFLIFVFLFFKLYLAYNIKFVSGDSECSFELTGSLEGVPILRVVFCHKNSRGC